MKTFRPAIVLVAVIGLLWIASDNLFPSGSWNYRMTVTVETPEGVKTGSAVRTVSYKSEASLFPGQGGRLYSVRGEAVVVDLGRHGLLFGLMYGVCDDFDYAHLIATSSFPSGEKTAPGAKVILDERQYPMFVRFADLNNPETVKAVAPQPGHCGSSCHPDSFETAFGKGVRLKAVEIETTGDPVTALIQTRLPWLATVQGYLSGKSIGLTGHLYQLLDKGAFKQGN